MDAASAISCKESDKILENVTHIGEIFVEIEGIGSDSLIACGESLRYIASQVLLFRLKKKMTPSRGVNPWILLDYNKNSGFLKVRVKE